MDLKFTFSQISWQQQIFDFYSWTKIYPAEVDICYVENTTDPSEPLVNNQRASRDDVLTGMGMASHPWSSLISPKTLNKMFKSVLF